MKFVAKMLECLWGQRDVREERRTSLSDFLDNARHLLNAGIVSYITIGALKQNYSNYFVKMYQNETIIYMKGKRLSYSNFPLPVVLSYCMMWNDVKGLGNLVVNIYYREGYTGIMLDKNTQALNIYVNHV